MNFQIILKLQNRSPRTTGFQCTSVFLNHFRHYFFHLTHAYAQWTFTKLPLTHIQTILVQLINFVDTCNLYLFSIPERYRSLIAKNPAVELYGSWDKWPWKSESWHWASVQSQREKQLPLRQHYASVREPRNSETLFAACKRLRQFNSILYLCSAKFTKKGRRAVTPMAPVKLTSHFYIIMISVALFLSWMQ